MTSADLRARSASGFTLLEVLVAFAILAFVVTTMQTVHVEAVRKGELAVDYREIREAADTVFRRIMYEVDKPDWPDGMRFTFDLVYGEYIGLPSHERDRWRSFAGVLRKVKRMAAGTDPSGQTPGLDEDEDGRPTDPRREEEPPKEGEPETGEEVYQVRLDVFRQDEPEVPFLTLATYLPVPESERRARTEAPR